MLKTIKTTKYLNLHELIKYVWENHEKIFEHTSLRTFESNNNATVLFTNTGHFETTHTHYPSDIFTVEVEEEITEDTELDCVISVDSDGDTFKTFNTSIDYLNSIYSDLVQILAYINGKFISIWERDNHGSN